MDKSGILENIEQKSKDIMSSNESLAVKLRKNKEIVDKFSKDLELLRSEMDIQSLKPGARNDIDNLKAELEEKQSLINSMIDKLKPLEVDMSRKENSMDALQQRIGDQGNKIESLSHDLLGNKKLLQELSSSNMSLKKKIAENEGIIKVTKNKLNEKVSMLNAAEQRNMEMQKTQEAEKKESFTFKNRLGAMEQRIHSTDEQNQKLLYEMIKMKDRLKSAETALEEKTRILDDNEATHMRNLESLKNIEEEKRFMIMKNHTKKVSVMNASIAFLKTKIQSHQSLIEEKARKEQALMSEFSSRMNDLMAARSEISAGIADIDDFVPDDTPELTEDLDKTDYSVDNEKVENFSSESNVSSGIDTINDNSTGTPQSPSKMDEIIPMIELAADHGDNADQIKHSLHSSGYSKEDIDNAFSKLNL